MISIDSTQDPLASADQIRHWRCGRIVMRGGRLVAIERRLFPTCVSIADVWWKARFGRADDDACTLDYHQPHGMPGFLTLDYIWSGRRTRYATFVGACHVLDEIARLRGSHAVVAHVSNAAISDRLLRRLGWQRHLEDWSGRHWIKRFYDGYPDSVVARYLQRNDAICMAESVRNTP